MLVVLWDETNPQQKLLLPFPCTLLHPSISLLCASNFHFRFLTLGATATLRLKAKQSKEVSPSGINHKSFVCICEACKAEREGGIQRYNTADANIVVNHTKVKAYICITDIKSVSYICRCVKEMNFSVALPNCSIVLNI